MCAAPGEVLLVVDRMPLRRAQLVRFLDAWANDNRLEILVCDVGDLIALDRAPRIGLAVLSIGASDLNEPKLSGALRVLRSLDPDTPIVVMSETADAASVDCALAGGAAGYIPATLEAAVALAALSFIRAGGSYFPAAALRPVEKPPELEPPLPRIRLTPPASAPEPAVRKVPPPGKTNGESLDRSHTIADGEPGGPRADAAPHAGDLTTRQSQVLGCLRMGHSNKQIARDLHMSEATVKVHVRQVMKRLGASNRTHAAVLAVIATATDTASATTTVGAEVITYAPAAAVDPSPPQERGVTAWTLSGGRVAS